MVDSMADAKPVTVTEVSELSSGLVQVRLRLADGTLRRVVMPASIASFDNVTFAALAVSTLLQAQRRYP